MINVIDACKATTALPSWSWPPVPRCTSSRRPFRPTNGSAFDSRRAQPALQLRRREADLRTNGPALGRRNLSRASVFRPHNVYGPDMGNEHVIAQFASRMNNLARQSPRTAIDFPIQGTGRETRSFVYVDDFIEGVRAVMEKGEHLNLYHVGAEEEITIEQLAVAVGGTLGPRSVAPCVAEAAVRARRCPNISSKLRAGYVRGFTRTGSGPHGSVVHRRRRVAQKECLTAEAETRRRDRRQHHHRSLPGLRFERSSGPALRRLPAAGE